ncbi:hypothetical protein BGX21_010142 [Mortierella sp. AD011]|nr:hypothetical protein BGX20_010154 [Mortierella sp. AD010]KAF9394992.1 hypothetical protein BGX21_010142 [Mortierella sp. AD011]
MAECYSSAGAPLNALANQLLGESSFSAKSSLFRSGQQQQQYQHQQQQLQQHHPQHLHQRQGLFPRYVPQQQKSGIDTIDSFEQAWASSSHSAFNHHHHHHQQQQQIPTSNFAAPEQYHQFQPQRHIPDLDLISAWDQQEQMRLKQDHANGQLHKVQTTVSGVTTASHPEFSTLEFENFTYTPATIEDIHNTGDSAWAQEWSRHKGAETDEDEDDEFREEWSNDYFTQAYISSHQSKFREIEEQDRLKEARLEEERERQRQASGGPPRSAWMMAGAVSTVTETAGANMYGPKRLHVPGLDALEDSQSQQNTAFNVEEFIGYSYYENNIDPQIQQSVQQQQAPKPIRSDDRFLSLVSDLHMAEQIYYPGATSATLPELSETDPENILTASASAMQPQTSTGGWAQEFAVEDSQRQQKQKYMGAEWNWEKLFGKDPRRQASSTLSSRNDAEGNVVDENDRLRAVALTRLQALFGHLSLTSPQGPNPTP